MPMCRLDTGVPNWRIGFCAEPASIDGRCPGNLCMQNIPQSLGNMFCQFKVDSGLGMRLLLAARQQGRAGFPTALHTNSKPPDECGADDSKVSHPITHCSDTAPLPRSAPNLSRRLEKTVFADFDRHLIERSSQYGSQCSTLLRDFSCNNSGVGSQQLACGISRPSVRGHDGMSRKS